MGFGLMGIIVPVIFIIVIVMFIVTAVKGIGQWSKNNNSPRLTVQAEIVTKRTNVSHHHHAGEHHHHHHHTSTTYYVTFQVESGDRMEFHVPGHEYGMLIEGDRGNLTFQGTRYLGFERASDFGDGFE